MTKREIIKWLKQEKVTALIKLGEEKDKAKRELCKKTYEEMNRIWLIFIKKRN